MQVSDIKLLLQDLFNMIHSVSKEMITATQCVPRIAERVTPAAAAHQKVQRTLVVRWCACASKLIYMHPCATPVRFVKLLLSCI